MVFANFQGARFALRIQENREKIQPNRRPVRNWRLVQVRPKDAFKELIKRWHIPPAIHVRFAESERTFSKNPPVKLVAMHDDVPGMIAVDRDARAFEEGLRASF